MSSLRRRAWLGGLFLLTAACSGGGDGGSPSAPPPPPPSGNVVVVTVRDFAFDPKSVQIEPGQTVRWVLEGGSMTNHTTSERNGVWDSGFVFRQAGDSFERTFPQAEDGRTFEYICTTHWVSNQMQGSVRVGEDAPPPNPGY